MNRSMQTSGQQKRKNTLCWDRRYEKSHERSTLLFLFLYHFFRRFSCISYQNGLQGGTSRLRYSSYLKKDNLCRFDIFCHWNLHFSDIWAQGALPQNLIIENKKHVHYSCTFLSGKDPSFWKTRVWHQTILTRKSQFSWPSGELKIVLDIFSFPHVARLCQRGLVSCLKLLEKSLFWFFHIIIWFKHGHTKVGNTSMCSCSLA